MCRTINIFVVTAIKCYARERTDWTACPLKELLNIVYVSRTPSVKPSFCVAQYLYS